MPKFPHSGYSANQSSGVLVKAQGSSSPSLDLDSAVGDAPQFRVTASRYDEKWWLSVTPGYVTRTAATSMITASNRSVTAGAQDIPDSTTFANWYLSRVEKVNCYKSLRYPDAANDLNIGQQYEADPNGGQNVLVALVCPYPGLVTRLVIIGETDFQSTFNYFDASGASGTGEYGVTAVIQVRSGAELTVTKDVNGKVTDVSLAYDSVSYWERVGLHVRVIAKLNTATGEVSQYSEGPQSFDIVSETYGVDVPYDDVVTPPSIIDGNWAAAFYNTGDSNAPSGYTFDY